MKTHAKPDSTKTTQAAPAATPPATPAAATTKRTCPLAARSLRSRSRRQFPANTWCSILRTTLPVNSRKLRFEYHPASDGPNAKTADDTVTVDLATRKLAVYNPPS